MDIHTFPNSTQVYCLHKNFQHRLYTFWTIGPDERTYVYQYAYTVRRAAQQQHSNMRKLYMTKMAHQLKHLLRSMWIPLEDVSVDIKVCTVKSVMLFNGPTPEEVQLVETEHELDQYRLTADMMASDSLIKTNFEILVDGDEAERTSFEADRQVEQDELAKMIKQAEEQMFKLQMERAKEEGNLSSEL